MRNKLTLLILLTITGGLLSCAGGGTSGTGLASARILSGTVTQSEGEPVENAVVTIQETGESDLTDANGEFEIGTELVTDTYNIQIEGSDLDTMVTVETISDDTQNLQVDINLNNSDINTSSTLSTIEVWAKVVGFCDPLFENNPRIRQSVAVPENSICTLKFYASSNNQKLERVPAILEVSSCDGLNWQEVATGTTGVGNRAGVGQIPFAFIDDADHCLYRLQAPVDVANVRPVVVYIDTFTYQNYLLALR